MGKKRGIDPLYSPRTVAALLSDFRAADYEWRAAHRNPAYYDFFVTMAPACARSLLDVGCGSGRLTLLLATRAHAAFGLDPSETLLTLGRERGRALQQSNTHWMVGDIEHPPYPPARFDYIVSCNALRLTDLNQSLGQIRNLLAPGGRLAIKDVVKTSRVPAPQILLHFYATMRNVRGMRAMYGTSTMLGILRDRFSRESLALMSRERSWVGERAHAAYTRSLPGCRISGQGSSVVILWDKPAP